MTMSSVVMHDGQPVTVQWAEEVGGDLKVQGHVVPNARFWEAVIEGSEPQDVASDALDAAVFRTEIRRVYVVTNLEKVLTTDFQAFVGRDFVIVERHEEMRIRPFMLGVMARFEIMPSAAAMIALFRHAEKNGHSPIAMVDRKVFFVKGDQRDRLFKRFGIQDSVTSNAHLMVRIGVLMKRPGGLRQDLVLPPKRFLEKDNDGTIVISRTITAPRPGTMLIHGQQPLYMKGMIRPPLHIGGSDESEGACVNAQFGLTVPEGAGLEATFYAVRTLPPERASLNYQAVLFGAERPEDVIDEDNQRLKHFKLEQLFTAEEMRKVRAGVPPALLMRAYAPWKWLRQFAVDGSRATVYGSQLVPQGHIRLLPETYDKFRTRVKDEATGEYRDTYPSHLVLHRDPACPNASSMALYQLDGPAFWSGVLSEDQRGIVVNPADRSWNVAGGDFDGDAAVAFRPTFQLKRLVGAQSCLKQDAGIGLIEFEGKTSIKATLTRMANGFTGRLGPAVMTAMRIRERTGTLVDTTALDAQAVVQGAVDAKKHPVDTRYGNDLYMGLREEADSLQPKRGFMLDQMHAVRTAPGEEGKIKAWKSLVAWCWEFKGKLNRVERMMARRVELLDAIFERTQWIRGDRAVLPDSIRDPALAWLIDNPEAYEQTDLIQELSQQYRVAVREVGKTTDDEQKAIHRDKAQKARLAIKMALRTGEISPAAMIAWGPHRLAAELVSAEDFERLGSQAAFLETTLFGVDWKDGSYKVEDLVPTHGAEDEVNRVLQRVRKVDLKVTRRSAKMCSVMLRW